MASRLDNRLGSRLLIRRGNQRMSQVRNQANHQIANLLRHQLVYHLVFQVRSLLPNLVDCRLDILVVILQMSRLENRVFLRADIQAASHPKFPVPSLLLNPVEHHLVSQVKIL